MYRNRTPQQITQQWQDDVEQSIEAGATPVMELGAGDMPIEDLASLLAVQRWSALRTDLTVPILPAGGLGPQWLAALLRPAPHLSEDSPPQPVVAYAGAAEVEYLTAAALLHAAAGPPASRPGLSTTTAAIPVSYFLPQSQPGKSLSWDAQPFLHFHSSPTYVAPPTAEAEQTGVDLADEPFYEPVAEDPLQDWLAWAGLLLALFLVLLAIFL